ncbi:MAG: hypothetical protein MUC87_18845 [Bacteroidia bacterium]|jgi:hypothetical protein|nr:hypothetical protein [Bacteroidia bacterium]
MISRIFISFPVLLLLFFASCDGDVRFTTDQPQGVSALPEVPGVLRGVWASGSDTLTIEPRRLSMSRSSRRTVPLADTARMGIKRIPNGKYVFRTGDFRTVERISGDSMIILSRSVNSYQLGRDTLLKAWNSSWWLSVRADSSTWKLMQISVRKKQLIIAVPSLNREEKRAITQRMDKTGKNTDNAGTFSQVTPFSRRSPNDNYFVVAASQAQLRQLQQKGLFRPVATFVKVK